MRTITGTSKYGYVFAITVIKHEQAKHEDAADKTFFGHHHHEDPDGGITALVFTRKEQI